MCIYQLISRSRSKTESKATCIQVNGVRHFGPEKQRQCFAKYFEDLALPKDPNYDNVFLELCNVRWKETEAKYRAQSWTGVWIRGGGGGGGYSDIFIHT